MGARANRRDTRAFRALFERYYGDVLGYARRRVPAASAQDVVSETFLVAWRRLADVPSHPVPWLFRVAGNVIANQRRAASRGEAVVRKLAVERLEPRRDPADAHANGEVILAALRRLSDGDREALMLTAWEGLDAARAGLVVGCSASAFTVRLHRARRRLERVLAELEHEDPVPNRYATPDGRIR